LIELQPVDLREFAALAILRAAPSHLVKERTRRDFRKLSRGALFLALALALFVIASGFLIALLVLASSAAT